MNILLLSLFKKIKKAYDFSLLKRKLSEAIKFGVLEQRNLKAFT